MWSNLQIWFSCNIAISMTLENLSVDICVLSIPIKIKFLTNGHPANCMEYSKYTQPRYISDSLPTFTALTLPTLPYE